MTAAVTTWAELDGWATGLDPGPVDLPAAERAVADLLRALGQDGPGSAATPRRVARAYADLLTPEPFEATTFANHEGYDEMVILKDVPFSSLCEHHLIPFSGRAHLAYLPGDRLLGLSKLARVVAHFASRLQMQEHLTAQIAGWLGEHLDPRGAGVVIEAEHGCMTVRGPRSGGARTVTSSLRGQLRTDRGLRAQFLATIGAR